MFITNESSLPSDLKNELKKFPSIKDVKITDEHNFYFRSRIKTSYENNFNIKGVIEIKVNESEYIADVLINNNDILKNIKTIFMKHTIKIQWDKQNDII